MSKQSVRALAGSLSICVWLAAAACAPDNGPASANAQTAPATTDDDSGSTVAATIGDRKITLDELDEFVKQDLFDRESSDGEPAKLYELRATTLERMIDQSVVDAAAAAAEMSATDYLENAVVTENDVTDEEVAAYYEANKDKMRDATFEQMSDRIRSFLRARRAADVVAKLRTDANANVILAPPRIEVAAIGPAKGPEGAPVTIVEFSDFQCPYCKRVVPTLNQIFEAYPDQVRVVFRHLPLDGIHNRARAAAEASACADKQGKFWAYHDLMFENNRALADEDLEKYAAEVSLDVDAFRQCVADREFQAAVEKDANDAEELGLHGTPAFFINGIPMRGAKPFDEFVSIIDSELARSAASTPSS